MTRILALFSWLAVILLWLCAAGVYVDPADFRHAGAIGLGFPFFVGGVVMMLLLTLLFARRHAWVPLLGLLCCWGSIRNYYPINFHTSPPPGAIKVLSYNTAGYGGTHKDAQGRHAIAAYIAESGADIVCLQEANTSDNNRETNILPLIRPVLPYSDTIMFTANVLAIHSRYPIVGKEIINYKEFNGSGVFKLLLAPGDTLHVVNCHLESMHLSSADRNIYHTMVRSPEESDMESGSRLLISKIATAAKVRSEQAHATAEYVERYKDGNLILCGDFNDTPISYTYNCIRSAGLTDAFVSTGNGLGRTFNRDAMFVRIDHLMSTSRWKPYACRIDTSISISDHYPIYAYFKRE